MGLYDYLWCDYPLPDEEAQGLLFQTKDTDEQYLENYTISKEGRLLLGGNDTNFHGAICFYGDARTGQLRHISLATMQDQFSHEQNTWYEYTALFKDGQLIDLRKEKNND